MSIRKNIITKRKVVNGANVEYLIEKMLGSKIVDKYTRSHNDVVNDIHLNLDRYHIYVKNETVLVGLRSSIDGDKWTHGLMTRPYKGGDYTDTLPEYS